jgi:hypothetical protein
MSGISRQNQKGSRQQIIIQSYNFNAFASRILRGYPQLVVLICYEGTTFLVILNFESISQFFISITYSHLKHR